MLEQRLFSFERPRQQLIRLGSAGIVFVLAAVGFLWSIVALLRVGIGSLAMLLFLRFPYTLLLTWVMVDVFIGSTVSIFNGNKLDTGLTLATLLVLLNMPLKETLGQMPALKGPFIYLLWVFLGIGISPLDLGAFLTQWVLILDGIGVALLTINVITTRQRLNRLIDSILLVSTFVSGYGIYGYITRQNGTADAAFPSLFRIGSIFGGVAPSLAAFLSVVIPLGIYRILTSHGFTRVINLMLVLVSLVALVLTFTRGAFISFPLSIILILPFLPSRKLKMGLLSGACVFALLLILVTVVGGAPIFDRFLSQDVGTLNGRTYLWQALLSHFDPLQLLGNGLGAANTLLAHLRVGYGGVIGTESHNLFLGTLYDHGIIGLALLIWVLGVLAVTLFSGMLKASGDQRTMFTMALVVFINLVLQSQEGNHIWSQAIGIYFWITMALPGALCWSAPGSSSQTDQPPGLLTAGARNTLADSDRPAPQ